MLKKLTFLFICLLAVTLPAFEYLHNGRFLGLDYKASLHRHKLQPHWEMTQHSYSAFRLLKDVEADVAHAHLNIKCDRPPQVGYDKLLLDADFTAVPHSPVRITFQARGDGQVSAYVHEYLLNEKGRPTWLRRPATLEPQPLGKTWQTYTLDYTPGPGELGAVMLRFKFAPAKGDKLDIDFGEVSAQGDGAQRTGVPATFVLPRISAPPLNSRAPWAGALRLAGFKDDFTGLPESGATTIQAGYDDLFLYLRYTVQTGEPPAAQFKEHDSTIFRDDSIEAIFAGVEDDGFAQIIVNANAAIYDSNRRDGEPSGWDSTAKAAAGKEEKGWWATLAIPRAEIPQLREENRPFRLNFLQTDKSERGGAKRVLYTCWSFAASGASHVTAAKTDEFPIAIMSPSSVCAGMDILADGGLQLVLQNPGGETHVFCEYGNDKAHFGTVKVIAPTGEKRFRLPYVPDNELAVVVVRDAQGREIYRNAEVFRHRLESHLGLATYLPIGYVELTSDITSIPEYQLHWSLEGVGKGVFEVKGKAKGLRISVEKLPLEKPAKLAVQILDSNGTSLGRRDFTVTRPAREPWTGSAMGEVDDPLPPFTPIRQAKDSLEFLQTSMHFGGRALPESVFSQGHNLLAAPVTLLLDGKELAQATRTVTSVKPNRVEWRAENSDCRWTGWAEEDGFTWYTVTVKAVPGQTASSLYLDIPVRREYATILNPMPVFRSGGDMDGRWAYDFKPWESIDFKQILTLRNEERGIELTAEDERDCSRAAEGGSHRLIPQDDRVVIRLTFIDKPIGLDRERTYRFGLQAFPAKPLVRKPDYLATCSYIDPRTTAWSGSLDKARIALNGLQGVKGECTVQWNAFWAFDPQWKHPDYHVQPLLTQNLVTVGNCGLRYNTDGGFTIAQAGKAIQSTLPCPPLTKGWHSAAFVLKGTDATLVIDGQTAAAFTGLAPQRKIESVSFGKSTKEGHADFHYEKVKVSRVAVEQSGDFTQDKDTVRMADFTKGGQTETRVGDVRQVQTERGPLPSTAAEFFTRLDALDNVGFKSHLGYLNRIFQFYGPRPQGYRNLPYTNDEGYEAFGKMLANLKSRGMRFYFGYSFGVRIGSREDTLYSDFYRTQPAAFYGSPDEGFWYMCAGCRDYTDYLLYYFDNLMKRYDNLGIYTDNLFICGRNCRNEAHGCGYRDLDANGELRQSGNLLNGRRFAKRLYAITKLRPIPREHFMHSSGENHAVFLSWADKYLCGEQYLENTNKQGWDIDVAQFRAQNDPTRAFGVISCAISTFVPFGHKGMVAVAGLHDCATYGAHHHRYPEDVFGYKPFLTVTGRFGTCSAEFLPYFRNAEYVTTDQGKRQYASVWLKPGRALVQVSNLTWQDAEVPITLHLAKLGLKGNASDALTGKPIPLANGSATLHIPSYDARWLLVE